MGGFSQTAEFGSVDEGDVLGPAAADDDGLSGVRDPIA